MVRTTALLLISALFLTAIVSPGPAEARHWRGGHWRGASAVSAFANHPYCAYGQTYRCNLR
jgi:hypothetical protein